jgi:hypothetical protein
LASLFGKLAGLLSLKTATALSVDVTPHRDLCTVRSRGLSADRLPELEIAACPQRFQEIAGNLLLQIARKGKDLPDALRAGETIEGRFVRADQPVIESFQLIRVGTDDDVLRVVDRDDETRLFPNHLIATHLYANSRAHPAHSLKLLLVAVEAWPMEKAASNATASDYKLNPHNFWSWIDLGTALLKKGNETETLAHWKIAVCMWPRGGRRFARQFLEQDSLKKSVSDFWRSALEPGVIRQWCVELGVTAEEASLRED